MYLELHQLIFTKMNYVPGTISTDFDTSLPQMVYVAVAMLVTNTIASLSVIIVR